MGNGRELKLDPQLPATIWEHVTLWFPRRPTIRILVVVDGSVSLDPNEGFGVGKMIEVLRKTAPHADPEFSYVRFEIETATRNATVIGGNANYVNFRFDQIVNGQRLIDRFDQIWCFGFNPGNTGDPSDALIGTDPTAVNNAELQALIPWMNARRGGVLAMGDHHYLGATMSWRIPRVRSMRRWTNADGVPPIDQPIQTGAGPVRYRHDTNQPQNPDQANPAGTAEIPRVAEEDELPQTIEVRRFGRFLRRPHPILCGGPLGAIDILPDHPHEGWVYEDADVPAAATYDVGAGITGADFPGAVDGGTHPLPQVIAWARPWTEPPYRHAKDPTPVTRFGVIGAYDGHRADVGRVVVDATWHHWFNMNIDGIETAGGNNWKKIKTYFRNVAVWLSPPAKQRSMLAYAAFWSLGTGASIENYDGGMPSWELGETARDILGQAVWDCFTIDWVRPFIPEAVLERMPPIPDPCLTCPPIDFFTDAALGGIIKAMLPERERIVGAHLAGKTERVDPRALALAVVKGAEQGVSEAMAHWKTSLEHTETTLKRVAARDARGGGVDALEIAALLQGDADR